MKKIKQIKFLLQTIGMVVPMFSTGVIILSSNKANASNVDFDSYYQRANSPLDAKKNTLGSNLDNPRVESYWHNSPSAGETSEIKVAGLTSAPYAGDSFFGQLEQDSLFVGMGTSNWNYIINDFDVVGANSGISNYSSFLPNPHGAFDYFCAARQHNSTQYPTWVNHPSIEINNVKVLGDLLTGASEGDGAEYFNSLEIHNTDKLTILPNCISACNVANGFNIYGPIGTIAENAIRGAMEGVTCDIKSYYREGTDSYYPDALPPSGQTSFAKIYMPYDVLGRYQENVDATGNYVLPFPATEAYITQDDQIPLEFDTQGATDNNTTHSTRGIILHSSYGSNPSTVDDRRFSFAMDDSEQNEADISQYFRIDREDPLHTSVISHDVNVMEKQKDIRVTFDNPGTLERGTYHLLAIVDDGSQVPFSIEIGDAAPTGTYLHILSTSDISSKVGTHIQTAPLVAKTETGVNVVDPIFSISAGSLPAGLSLDQYSGVISGVPEESYDGDIQINVSSLELGLNSDGHSSTVHIHIEKQKEKNSEDLDGIIALGSIAAGGIVIASGLKMYSSRENKKSTTK